MSSISINKLLEMKTQKLNTMKNTTILLECKNNIKDELQDINSKVIKWEVELGNIKSLFKKAEGNLFSLRNELSLLEKLNESYRKVNSSPQIAECVIAINKAMKSDQNKPSVEAKLKSENAHCPENLESNKSSNGNKVSKTTVTINLLTQAEFNTIPKYIIGRNTVAVLNSFVNVLNDILKDKYNFLALGRMKAKNRNKLEKYLQYKSQNAAVKIAKGNEVHFFTEEDYQIFTQSKLDKIKLNFLTALRHVKRLDFVKIGKDMYYAAVD